MRARVLCEAGALTRISRAQLWLTVPDQKGTADSHTHRRVDVQPALPQGGDALAVDRQAHQCDRTDRQPHLHRLVAESLRRETIDQLCGRPRRAWRISFSSLAQSIERIRNVRFDALPVGAWAGRLGAGACWCLRMGLWAVNPSKIL